MKFKKTCKTCKLSNGATLLYKRTHQKGYHGTAICVGFTRGAKCERVAGSMHFLEHQLFNGSEKFSKADIFELKKQVYLNGSTSPDSIKMESEFSNKLSGQMFSFLAESLLNSKFTQENINSERGVIHEELNRIVSESKNNLNMLHKLLYCDDCNSINDVIGTHESIDSITLQHLQTLREENFCAEYFAVSVVSSMPLFRVKKLIKKNFFPLLKSAEKVEENLATAEFRKKGNTMRVYTDERERVECKISFISNLGLLNCQNVVGLANVGRNLEKNGLTVHNDLRENGLVYASKEYSVLNDETSLYMFEFSTSKEKFLDVIKIIGEHIHFGLNNPLTEEKIEEIKTQSKLKDDISIDRFQPKTMARNMFYYFVENQKNVDVNENKLLKKLKSEHVTEFVRAFFNENTKMQISVRGNLTEQEILSYDELRAILLPSKK